MKESGSPLRRGGEGRHPDRVRPCAGHDGHLEPLPYAVLALRRFTLDGRLVLVGATVRSDSLRVIRYCIAQGNARPLDEATRLAAELADAVQRATPRVT